MFLIIWIYLSLFASVLVLSKLTYCLNEQCIFVYFSCEMKTILLMSLIHSSYIYLGEVQLRTEEGFLGLIFRFIEL